MTLLTFIKLLSQTVPEVSVVGEDLVPKEHVGQPPVDGHGEEVAHPDDGVAAVAGDQDQLRAVPPQLRVPAADGQLPPPRQHQLRPAVRRLAAVPRPAEAEALGAALQPIRGELGGVT